MDDDPLSQTMRKIAAYLDDHPEAADTLTGIHGVWLQSEEMPSITRLALERLLEADVLECACYSRDNTIWRLRRPR
jgi:hypothetical protein